MRGIRGRASKIRTNVRTGLDQQTHAGKDDSCKDRRSGSNGEDWYRRAEVSKHLVLLPGKLFEIRLFQHLGQAHLDPGPDRAYRTVLGKRAFLLVKQADVQAHPPFDRLNDVKHGYFARLARKRKTALYSPIGPDDLGFYEFLEDLRQKTSGDLVFLRYFVDEADLFDRMAGEIEYTTNAVIPFSSDLHGITISDLTFLSRL